MHTSGSFAISVTAGSNVEFNGDIDKIASADEHRIAPQISVTLDFSANSKPIFDDPLIRHLPAEILGILVYLKDMGRSLALFGHLTKTAVSHEKGYPR